MANETPGSTNLRAQAMDPSGSKNGRHEEKSSRRPINKLKLSYFTQNKTWLGDSKNVKKKCVYKKLAFIIFFYQNRKNLVKISESHNHRV